MIQAHPVRFSQPEEVVEEAELKEKLAESLELLTEKERRVIELYYYEDMTLKEISKILEVSESRISQLHTKALNKMRKKNGCLYEYSDGVGADLWQLHQSIMLRYSVPQTSRHLKPAGYKTDGGSAEYSGAGGSQGGCSASSGHPSGRK